MSSTLVLALESAVLPLEEVVEAAEKVCEGAEKVVEGGVAAVALVLEEDSIVTDPVGFSRWSVCNFDILSNKKIMLSS